MVQGYYTLQEAAQVLGMTVDDLKAVAQKNQIRSFQDRGTLRFRIQDIQELQRQRLGNSDPELVLGDAVSPRPMPAGGPKSGTLKTPKPGSGAKPADALDFAVDDDVAIGKEPLPTEGSSARKSGPKSATTPKSGLKSPKQGSDSDVKLVAEGSDNFSIQLGDDLAPSVGDSDVRLGELPTKKSGNPSSRKSGLGRRSSKLGPSPADSGVRLVPMEDSGVRLDATESDVRLDRSPTPRRSGLAQNSANTEEINLDDEIQKLEAADKKPRETKFKTTPSMYGKPGSPFELSENDFDDKPTKATDGSSDFEIASAGPKSSPPKSSPPKSPRPGKKKSTEFELAPSGDSDEDFSLELDDESLDLGGDLSSYSGPKSGINLSRPSDKGISLESPRSGDPADFELNLGAAPPTPRPSKKPETTDDDDFELSLDDPNDASTAKSGDFDDSEFELSLDDDDGSSSDSTDSEFELALDDVDDRPAPSKPAPKKKATKAVESDLFETDFDLPAIDEDGSNGSETVDAGSSDFELALDDTDIGAEDESGSQVVALEEEEYEDAGETVDGDLDEYEEGDIEEEAEVEERIVIQEVIRDRWVKPAPWGVLPVIFMFPSVVVMILVGIMGWELVQQTSNGYKNSGLLTRSIANMMDIKIR